MAFFQTHRGEVLERLSRDRKDFLLGLTGDLFAQALWSFRKASCSLGARPSASFRASSRSR